MNTMFSRQPFAISRCMLVGVLSIAKKASVWLAALLYCIQLGGDVCGDRGDVVFLVVIVAFVVTLL